MTRRRPGIGAAWPLTMTALLLLLAAGGGAGCAAGPADPASTGVDSVTRVDGSSSISRTRPGGLMPGLDRGLRSWQWRILERRLPVPLGELIASVAVPIPDSAGVDEATAERLARNGLRLVAVPRGAIDRLRELVVAPSKHVETWHGEAVDWRPLALARPPGDAAAVAIGERVQRYPSGSFRLAARAWTMRMEDGPHLHVELRVDHVAERSDRGLLAGRVRPVTRLVDDLAIEIAAPVDLAWLIVPAAAGETWPAPGTRLAGARSRPASPAAAPASGDEEEPAEDPADGSDARALGPPVLPIPTVGELLLARQTGPGERELIILEPEIPASMFPAPAPAPAPAAAMISRGGSR